MSLFSFQTTSKTKVEFDLSRYADFSLNIPGNDEQGELSS